MPQPESPIEQQFRTLWLQRVPHIPLIAQYEILGGRYRLDFAYPAAKIAIELDGYEHHNSYRAFTADRQRDRALQREGWRVLHFSGEEITHSPEQCVEEVRGVIEAAEQRGLGGPHPARTSALPVLLLAIMGGVVFVVLGCCVVGALFPTDRSASLFPPISLPTPPRRTAAPTRTPAATPALVLATAPAAPPAPATQAPIAPPPDATSAPGPAPATATAAPLIGQVINGGNLRSERRISPATVIGQICPGDRLAILEHQRSDGQLWYRVRLVALAADCHPQRVALGAEGWLSSTLVAIP